MKRMVWIEGMTCMGCSGRIDRLLNSIEGVDASVSLEEGKAIVEAPESISNALLKSTIEHAGFVVIDIR